MSEYTKAWHFFKSDGERLILRDGSEVKPGEWLEHPGEIEICKSGLHSSRMAIDALNHVGWRNPVACLVEVDKIVTEHRDKLVSRRRRIISYCKADEVLGAFARWCALTVIHLWEAPEVVKRYLETGKEELRESAQRSADANANAYAAYAAAYAANAANAAACDEPARARGAQNRQLEMMLRLEMGLKP